MPGTYGDLHSFKIISGIMELILVCRFGFAPCQRYATEPLALGEVLVEAGYLGVTRDGTFSGEELGVAVDF